MKAAVFIGCVDYGSQSRDTVITTHPLYGAIKLRDQRGAEKPPKGGFSISRKSSD